MRRRYISIKIEGDFIDSFIYSGILFLVGANSQISIYNWEGLLDATLHNQRHVLNFLKDCRKGLNSVKEYEYQEIYIEEQQLEDQKYGEPLPLKAWSTDINVYSDYLYIADENGVDAIKLDFDSKRLEQETRFQLWDKYAYKISPNDNKRIAIAAGVNGVITAFPRRDRVIIGSEDIKTIAIKSYDCEWIGNNLIINSKDGSFMSVFEELPQRPEGSNTSKDFWTRLEKSKKQPPNTLKIEDNNRNSIIYSWMAGRKIFSILRNGHVILKDIDLLNDANSYETINFKIEICPSGILSVRSGMFGAVIENGDNLLSLTQNGVDLIPISHRPVSWRVFPRSKSYLNHLHIVENEYLVIRAYFVSNENDSDDYGISFNEFI